MNVHVGSILHSYTGGRDVVTAKGRTLADVFVDLDRSFPGIRFRIVDEQDRLRPHIAVFVGNAPTRNLGSTLDAAADIHVLGALSGG